MYKYLNFIFWIESILSYRSAYLALSYLITSLSLCLSVYLCLCLSLSLFHSLSLSLSLSFSLSLYHYLLCFTPYSQTTFLSHFSPPFCDFYFFFLSIPKRLYIMIIINYPDLVCHDSGVFSPCGSRQIAVSNVRWLMLTFDNKKRFLCTQWVKISFLLFNEGVLAKFDSFF